MTIVVIGDNTGNDFAGTEDTRIHSADPTVNFGADTNLEVSKYGTGDHQHTLIKFSGLSNIPAGSTINSATLSIRLASAGGGATTYTIGLRRILRAWVEAQATWNIYATSNNWTTAGCLSDGNDRIATISSSLQVNTTAGYKSFTGLAADVQGFVDGTYSNYGWHLERTDGLDDATWRGFDSSEVADGSRPYLTVDYTPAGASGAVIHQAIYRGREIR